MFAIIYKHALMTDKCKLYASGHIYSNELILKLLELYNLNDHWA